MEMAVIESGVGVTQHTIASMTTRTAPPNLAAQPGRRKKTPAFLSNLGRPTLRGIRKCPRCGIYNGTRGRSCKNKACGAVFRNVEAGLGRGGGARRDGAEAVRLVTSGDCCGSAHVFSVRHRGRDHRGFVELVPTETEIATADGTLLTQLSLGRCLLPACRHEGQSIAVPTSQQQPETPCTHVKLAMQCQVQATPLPFKSSMLEALQAPPHAKEQLWQLATESPGPLVQRVSQGTLVVKCHVTERHPLGLLHLIVDRASGGRRAQLKSGFQCECQGESPTIREAENLDGGVHSLPEACSFALAPHRCLHFYACVCAFNSDERLSSEFSDFLSLGSNGMQVGSDSSLLSTDQHVAKVTANPKAKRLYSDDGLTVSSIAQAMMFPVHTMRKPVQRKQPISVLLKKTSSSQPVDESHVSLGFHQWLASVTERIHQTMHYQFDGKPEPLVFHIPQSFFNALQQRLSLGTKKRRLPNSTTAFVRNGALPLGTFSKYTWHITNLLQVKRIFDTPELPLELTQSFVKNRDGSFSPFRCPDVPPEPVTEGLSRLERPQPIRPLELRTFLRVGNSSPDQKGPQPFVIEWIPDILPRSKVGELRIRFEYGHQHSGQTEQRDGGVGRANTSQQHSLAENDHTLSAPAL